MSLDPTDGCTFWYTNEYYAADGLNDLTRIGSFRFPSCTSIGNGTVQGTVTVNPGGAPISGATVAFGARTATTNGSGFYSFSNIPAGTYPSITASKAGSNSNTSTPVVVTDGGTTVKDFALTAAPTNGCLTDTSQANFSLEHQSALTWFPVRATRNWPRRTSTIERAFAETASVSQPRRSVARHLRLL